LTFTNTRSEELARRQSNPYAHLSQEHIKAQKLHAALTREYDVFDEYLDLNRYAEMYLSSVARVFQARDPDKDLVKEFYIRNLRLIEARGFKLIRCTVSVPYTQHMLDQLGFVEKAHVKYCQAKDEEGKLIAPGVYKRLYIAAMIKTID